MYFSYILVVKHHMEAVNLTQISEFLLLGLSEDPELQPHLFGLFLSTYLITLLGNLLIILAVSSDSHCCLLYTSDAADDNRLV